MDSEKQSDMPRKKVVHEAEVVSCLEFSRRVGCNETTIRDYITAGKIHGPAITLSPAGKPKIIYAAGLVQFNAARENVAHKFHRSGHTLDKPVIAPPKLSARATLQMDNLMKLAGASPEERDVLIAQYEAGEYDLPDTPVVTGYIRESRAANGKLKKDKRRPVVLPHAGEILEGARRPQPHGGNLKTGKDQINADISGTLNLTEEELSQLDVNQLNKKVAVLNVMAKQIEVGKQSGELIRRSDVYASLFTFGTEIRNRFEAMPSRVIDLLLSAPNRAAAMVILTREINNALSMLAESGSVQLTAEQNRTAK